MHNPLPLICIGLPVLIITFGLVVGVLCELGVLR